MKTSFPREKIKVVLLEGIHPRARELFEGEGFAVDAIPRALEGKALREAASGAHVLGIRSGTRMTGEALAGAPRLLGLGCFCIGTNQVDTASACQHGVPVFNSPFSNTRSVAELTIAEIVALFRRVIERSAQLHAGIWEKSAAGAREVRGKTLGIVGYGHIGTQVSILAEALGMRVIYHDIVPKLPLGNARPVKTLAALLEQSDVVTVHVPATKQTEKMIGAAQLKRMRAGALLINNARGSVVDVGALAGALRSGHLGGAAADVFPVEPAGKGEPFDSELRGLGNVILTPHIGGSTEESQEAIADDVATKLIRFINNGSTSGAVNVPTVDLPEQVEDGRRRHRILHFHRNVPGVLSKMHGLIADLGVNIAAEHLQTNRDVGYVVLDVDPRHGERMLEGLRSIPETIRVRMLW